MTKDLAEGQTFWLLLHSDYLEKKWKFMKKNPPLLY
jgi:hypothetical protein